MNCWALFKISSQRSFSLNSGETNFSNLEWHVSSLGVLRLNVAGYLVFITFEQYLFEALSFLTGNAVTSSTFLIWSLLASLGAPWILLVACSMVVMVLQPLLHLSYLDSGLPNSMRNLWSLFGHPRNFAHCDNSLPGHLCHFADQNTNDPGESLNYPGNRGIL